MIVMENASSMYPYSTGSSHDQREKYPHSTAWLATVPLILSIIIAVTVVGNIMVMAAYFRDHRIQANVANLFILNLAITDFIVGAVILTIDTTWIIKDYWAYGEVFCKVWLTVDFTVTMMSVATMVLISWDRYCLLTMGMRYKTFQTKKRIGVILAVTWTTAGTTFSFLAFAWSAITGEYNVDYGEKCEMEFTYNIPATLVMNMIEFFIPFTVLIMLNIAVYINIRRRSRGSVGQSPPNNVSMRSPTRSYAPTGRSPRRGNYCQSEGAASEAVVPTANELSDQSAESQADGSAPINSELPKSVKKVRTFKRHRKAALVLAVLIGCFMLCWLPYQVTSIMFAVCGNSCVSDRMWEVTNILLWCNSTINPFIYAATNVHFRRNFRHFLLLDRWACDMKRCKVKRQRPNQNQFLHDTVNDSVAT